jgi:rod shape-determining protein MreB and related proteins
MSTSLRQWLPTQASIWPIASSIVFVDMGSLTTRISFEGHLQTQPSCIAYHQATGQVIAIGVDAVKWHEKSTGKIKVWWPIAEGVIAEPTQASMYLQAVLKQLPHQNWWAQLLKPTVVVTVPSSASPVDWQLFEEICQQGGAGRVELVAKSQALAQRSKEIAGPSTATVMLDCGDQTTEVVVVAEGSAILARTLPIGGATLTQEIIRLVHQHHQCAIGIATAQKIKHQLIDVAIQPKSKNPTDKKLVIRGKSLTHHLPMSITIEGNVFSEALRMVVVDWLKRIGDVLTEVSPEVIAQAFETGIILSGGGAQLQGFDQLIANVLKTQVVISKQAQWDLILGARKIVS